MQAQCRRQRFLMGRWLRKPKYFAKQGIFGIETNQTRREQATRGEWRPVQLAVLQNVALGAEITRDKFFLQPQLADQRPHRFRKSGTLRTCFKHKSISSDRGDYAASFSEGLQNYYPDSQLPQAKRARQSRDAPADHYCFAYVRHSM